MRRLLLGLLLAATPLAAQEANPWRLSDFPYFMGDPTNGVLIIGHAHLARDADYESRLPFDGYLGLEGAYGTRGSRFATLKFRAPFLVRAWRFAFDAGAVREARFGYYGTGPEGDAPTLDPSEDTGDHYRVRRSRYYARAEATRHVKGPLHVAVSAGLTHFRYTRRTDGLAFQTDYFDITPVTGTDAVGRLALVFDSRDKEFVTTKGFLLEAGLYFGSGRFEQRNLAPGGGGAVSSFTDKGYTGAYTHLRGFFSPRAGTVLAGRLLVRALGANAPLDARYTLPAWERELTVMGGADSHRSFVKGRLLGRGLLLGSAEVRHNVVDVGDYGGVTVVAFLDAGRTFQEGPRLTLSDLRVGGGGGVALRVVRSAILNFNFATGPDGFTFSMLNGWPF